MEIKSLESNRRVLISELDECRSMTKRKKILTKIFKLDKDIKELSD